MVTVGFVQEYRSEKSLEELNRLVPHRWYVYYSGIFFAYNSLLFSTASGLILCHSTPVLFLYLCFSILLWIVKLCIFFPSSLRSYESLVM